MFIFIILAILIVGGKLWLNQEIRLVVITMLNLEIALEQMQEIKQEIVLELEIITKTKINLIKKANDFVGFLVISRI